MRPTSHYAAVGAMGLISIGTMFWGALALIDAVLPAFFITIVVVLPIGYALASIFSPHRVGGQHR